LERLLHHDPIDGQLGKERERGEGIGGLIVLLCKIMSGFSTPIAFAFELIDGAQPVFAGYDSHS
jgi:hypothetical protein